MASRPINNIVFGKVYPYYIKKVEAKGRSKAELDEVISWLTGYNLEQLEAQIVAGSTFEQFFAQAPKLNPSRSLITGTICGMRVETIEDPLTRDARCLDKLIDELAKGRPMAKVLRTG